MADVYSEQKRREVMCLIKSSQTKPELIVRQFLFYKGFRYRLHQKDLPGKPDIALKKIQCDNRNQLISTLRKLEKDILSNQLD